MQPTATKTLVIDSDMLAIRPVLELILDQVKVAGYPQAAHFAIHLSLEEALTNAVRHGNCNKTGKHVTIEYQVTPAQVTISVEDEGCGFHPEHLPDPTADENIQRPCGRGVMLMRAYMTEVHFNERGNRVTMIKRPDCPLPGH